MESTQHLENTAAISSAADVLQLVRREFIKQIGKVAIVFAVFAIAPYWMSGETKFLYLCPSLLIVAALMTYTGRYIPLSNKHDSLVNKHGDIYVGVVAAAINQYGIRTLLSTRWFETYADEYCQQSSKD